MNIKKKIILFIALLLSPIFVNAQSIECSVSSSTVELGDTFSVTFSATGDDMSSWQGILDADTSKLSVISGTTSKWFESGANLSKTWTFRADSLGTASIGQMDVVAIFANLNRGESAQYCSVNIVEATRPNGGDSSNYNSSSNNEEENVDPDKSSNNYLKSLSIDGVKISPEFNKDKVEYTAVVSGDKEKINIKGEVEDEKSSVDGLGEKEIKEGINKLEIIVTAENGQTRKYIISITRKEKNPIEVTINKKKYTVAKKEIGLKVPDGFTKTTVVIEKEEVVAYSNSFTGYLLVALVDEDGNAAWYIYNSKNGTYTKYSEFKSDGVRLIILKASKKDIPYKYKKCKIEINGEIVDGYALEYNSPFRLVYALNMNTGEKGFYLYDMDENTFQRFYNIQVNIYRNLLKKLEIGIICLLSIITIMSIVIVSLGVINKKTKKFIKNGGKKEKEDIIVDEEEEEEKKEELKKKVKEKSDKIKKDKKEKEQVKTNKFDKSKKETKDIDKPLTREEIRKRKKEEKEELAKARRDFFE